MGKESGCGSGLKVCVSEFSVPLTRLGIISLGCVYGIVKVAQEFSSSTGFDLGNPFVMALAPTDTFV